MRFHISELACHEHAITYLGSHTGGFWKLTFRTCSKVGATTGVRGVTRGQDAAGAAWWVRRLGLLRLSVRARVPTTGSPSYTGLARARLNHSNTSHKARFFGSFEDARVS